MNDDLMIKMVLDTWYAKVKDADRLFDKLTDEQLQNEVAPGRNRGIYLLGHMVAVHDRMLPLLDLEERSFTELDEAFISNPDKAFEITISATELKQNWKDVNAKLASHFNKMQSAEWFTKHKAVSEEDFVKELHRNKLNVIINRTNHLSGHLGQLIFLDNAKP